MYCPFDFSKQGRHSKHACTNQVCLATTYAQKLNYTSSWQKSALIAYQNETQSETSISKTQATIFKSQWPNLRNNKPTQCLKDTKKLACTPCAHFTKWAISPSGCQKVAAPTRERQVSLTTKEPKSSHACSYKAIAPSKEERGTKHTVDSND